MSTYSNLNVLSEAGNDDYVLVIEQDGSVKKIASSKIPGGGLSATIIEYSSNDNSGGVISR